MNIDQILDRLKNLGSSLTVAQRVSLVAFLSVVGMVVGSTYLLNRENYVLLFSDLDAEAASTVVGKLKTLKVTYELADGGRSIRVPDTRVDELRLEFASQGMPTSGRIGFEIFDQVSFGATEFLEQVNYRRALEGEIARTIGTLSEVASARVHISVAKSSLFETKEQPAKASVVLKLRGNRPIAPATVQGICGLVAAAVEGLRPESVVVLDSFGRPLSKQGEPGEQQNGGPSMERQLVVERDLSSKLVAMLEPVVGTGRVRVNVAARLNSLSEEQTEERWDPNSAVVRSRQINADTTPVPASATQTAGARANLPEAPDQKPADPAPKPAEPRMAGRNAETVNYEISRLTRHTVRPNGEVSRLSVAVILDDQEVVTPGKDGTTTRKNAPRSREEMQKIQGLVTAAVGIDASRGDQITVENVAFDDRQAPEDVAPQTVWQKYAPQISELGRVATVLIFGLLAFVMVIRPMMKRALGPSLPVPVAAAVLPGAGIGASVSNSGPPPPTVQDLQSAIEAELDAAAAAKASEHPKVPVLSRRVGQLTSTDPEHAARLIRAWIQEDTKQR